MMLRMARLGVLAAAVLGLLGTHVPAADATTVGALVFTGFAGVANGNNTIAYPCFGGLPTVGPVGTPDLALCQLIDLNHLPTPNLLLPLTHNPSNVVFTTDNCVGVAVNILKLTKATIEGPFCGLAAGGIVLGHCGLSQGTVTGTATSTPGQNFNFTASFGAVGGVLVVTGAVTKTNSGTLAGVVNAFPPNDLGGFGSGSCLNLHPLVFRIVGIAAFVIPTI